MVFTQLTVNYRSTVEDWAVTVVGSRQVAFYGYKCSQGDWCEDI